MRKILISSLLFAGLASPQGRPIDWPSYGGNAQRTGWEKSDIRITRTTSRISACPEEEARR